MSPVSQAYPQFPAKHLPQRLGLGLVCIAWLLSACAPSVVLPTLRPTLTHMPLPTHTVVIPTAALPVATATLRAYPPPPHGTASPFDATATRTTPDATIMALVTDVFATQNALSTPLAPFSGTLAPGQIYDDIHHFTIYLPPGWSYSLSPYGGAMLLANYENISDYLPDGGVLIELGAGAMPLGQTITQVVESRLAYERSFEDGISDAVFSTPEPFTLGAYTGLSYVISPTFGIKIRTIFLESKDGRLMGINIKPADSPALPEALQVLATVELLPLPKEKP